MADKLTFSLVSPERELYSGTVDQVDVPGTEGDLGILPNHSPLMAAIRTGTIKVYENGTVTEFFVQGGFADVTPTGLTVLAETAVARDAIDRADIKTQISDAEINLESLSGEAESNLRQNLDGLKDVLAN